MLGEESKKDGEVLVHKIEKESIEIMKVRSECKRGRDSKKTREKDG